MEGWELGRQWRGVSAVAGAFLGYEEELEGRNGKWGGGAAFGDR